MPRTRNALRERGLENCFSSTEFFTKYVKASVEIHLLKDFRDYCVGKSRSFRRQESNAFIDGALHALDISESHVSCASGRCGTVKKLDEQIATKLAKVLEQAVTREHERLKKEADLPPHLRRDRFERADTE